MCAHYDIHDILYRQNFLEHLKVIQLYQSPFEYSARGLESIMALATEAPIPESLLQITDTDWRHQEEPAAEEQCSERLIVNPSAVLLLLEVLEACPIGVSE